MTTCSKCGSISLGLNGSCLNCGADLADISDRNQMNKSPSESTIDIKAEEIK